MKSHRFSILAAAAVTLLSLSSNVSLAAGLVTFEAESGALGSDFAVSNTSSPAYITILSDSAAYNPGSAARVASYTVTFPSAGTYQLYARIRVGPDGNGFNDDSMFYATGFGSQSPTLNSDWVFVNGLADKGYTAPGEVVNGSGAAGIRVWKWINLSQFAGNVSFTVNAGNLTRTFQIGARENGLDLDKFAFGTVGTSFAVSNLDAGTLPVPPPPVILTNAFPGPDGMALHRFNPLNQTLNLDGANPAAGLTFSGGVLIGTTVNGGLQGEGTAFCLSLDGANFSAFRSFTNTPDAGNPKGPLAVGSGDDFFGTSQGGGKNGVGAVFQGSTNGSVSVLHSFAALSADNATNSGGASPGGRLALSGNTLYGTATAGGAHANGTVFSLSTNGSDFAVLHDFSSLDSNTGTNTDGALPCGGLILSGNTLYGTASAGGAGGAGVVFSIRTNGGDFTVLHNFTSLDPVAATNSDGAFPSSGLLLTNGVLYGTTIAGGTGGKGVVFSITTSGLDFAVLHDFSAINPLTGTNGDGAAPCATLAARDAHLYGTTSAGGAGASGTIFSVTTNGTRFHTIHAFTARDPSSGTNRDGALPVAGVLPLGNSLYGTTFGGGPGGEGTVFKVAIPSPSAIITNVIHDAEGSVTLFCVGGLNSTNIMQAASALTSPVAWRNVATNVADETGAWVYVETNATNPARFYRSYAPQN